MTVKELRYLVDNLDEYIHVPGGIERLKKTVLHLAVSGQLVPQDPSEGTGEELYQQIQAEKAKLITEGKLKKQKPLPAITEAEIPFAIPKTWKWVRFDDALPEYQNGASSRGDSQGEPIVVLRLADIKDKKISLSNTRKILLNKNSIHKYQLTVGDILVTRVNGSADLVGRFSLCDQPVEAIYCDHFIRMRINRNWISPAFNLLLGESLPVRLKISELFITTAGQKTVNQKHINSLVIPLVPVHEQVRILRKVDAIFALIDELAEKYRAEQAEREKLVASSLAQLARSEGDLAFAHLGEIIRTKADAAQLRKTILHLAVSGQLVPQDPSEGTGEELYQQIQAEKTRLISEGKLKKQKPFSEITRDEIPFKIPKNWKWARLGEVFTFINGDRGKNYPSKDKLTASGDIPFFSAVNLENNEIGTEKLLYLSNAQYDALGSGKVRLNDLIVCIRGSLGKHAISNYDIGAIASSLVILRNQTSLQELSSYTAMYLDSDLFSSEIKRYDNGTAQPNLSADNLKRFLLPLPPLTEQTRIVQKTTQLLDLVTELEKHLGK